MDAQVPALAAGFGASLAAAAQTITGFSIAYGLVQLAFGPMADRFGKWRMVTLAVVTSSLTAAACATAASLPSLIAMRALAGATCGGIIPLAMAWIGDAVPYEQRQPVLARFLTGQIIGFAGGQWLGGLAADHGLWRLPFVLMALWFAVISVLLWRARCAAEAAAPLTPRSGHIIREALHVFAQPWARVVILVVFIEGTLVFGAWAFVPTHLHLRGGMSLAAAGAAVMSLGIGGLAFAATARRWVLRWGEQGLARGGGCLIAIAFVAIALLPTVWVAVPAAVAFGFGFYMLHNTLQTNATQMAPAARGAAVALFASALFGGQTVGVASASLLVERFGTAVVIAAAGIAVVPLAWHFAFLRRRRRAMGD